MALIRRLWETPSFAATLGRAGGFIVLAIGASSLTDYPLRTPWLSGLLALATAWLAFDFDNRANVANAARSA